jgi:hypothetical protein
VTIGDRIVCMDNEDRGTILSVERDGYLLVELDDYPLPHYSPVAFHPHDVEWMA